MNEVTITLKARDGKVLNTTESGNVRANATRRNPRAGEENQPATLPMDQVVEYSYFNAKNGSFTVKFINDVHDYTFYVADKSAA